MSEQPTPVDPDLTPWESFPECPDCHGRDWHFGPRGGAAINMQCLNCEAWFNTVFLLMGGLAGPGSGVMIQRIRRG